MRLHNSSTSSSGILLALLLLGGCGGGEDATTDGPLDGRELSRAGQLEGTWLGVNQGDFVGFEFMDDGKVLATPVTAAMTGGGVMYQYSVLDGGRLSLMTPNGRTQTFKVTLSGDYMELEGGMMLSPSNTQRFRRLKRGQTLEQGIEEQEKLDAAAYRERYDGLTKYLAHDDLVMAPGTPGLDAPAAIALELDISGPGRGWYDDKPPHLDEIGTAIDTVANDATRPALRITFGKQLDPPAQQPRGASQITFDSSGDADEPRLLANVNYGNKPFQLEIRRDAKLHREIVGRFDAEKERIEALRAPLLSALKDYAVIEGRSGAQYANQATQDRFVLVRDAATGKFAGEGTLSYENRVPQTGEISADVLVYGDQAMLVIDGFYRRYQLTLPDADAKDFDGAWFPAGQQNGWKVNLAITEAIDAAERERRAEAQRSAMRKLSATTSYFGRAPILPDAWGAPQPFVMLTVTPGADGSFSATARYPSLRLDVAMKGQVAESIAGPALQLRYGGSEVDPTTGAMLPLPQLERQLQNQVWSLTLAEPGNEGSLLEGGGTSMGAVSLEPMTDAWKKRQLETVKKTLAAGADFHAWSMTQRQAEPAVFKFRLDAATGELNAVVPERSGPMGIWPGQTYEGKFIEQYGVPAAEFTYEFNHRRDYSMDWWAYVRPDDSILLIGNFAQISAPRAGRRGFEMELAR
jgi:hypothetical protein